MSIQLASLPSPSIPPVSSIRFDVCCSSSLGVLSGGGRCGCSKPNLSGGALTRWLLLTPSTGTLDALTVVGDGDNNNFVIGLTFVDVLGFNLELELVDVVPTTSRCGDRDFVRP